MNIKTWEDRLEYPHSNSREQTESAMRGEIYELRAAIAKVPPEAPPECQTDAEKRAYAFGWWKALESLALKELTDEEIMSVAWEVRREWNKSTNAMNQWMHLGSDYQYLLVARAVLEAQKGKQIIQNVG